MTEGAHFIAHRGLTTVAPENTRAALCAALEDPAIAGVELDIQLTADHVPLVFHDHELDRLTQQSGKVSDHTSVELQACRVDGHSIPTLEQIVAVPEIGRRQTPTLFNVELKATDRAKALVQACRGSIASLMARANIEVVVSTFDPRIIHAVYSEGLDWPLAFLYDDLRACAVLKHFPDAGRGIDLHPRHSLLNEEHLFEYSAENRVFRTWTVDCETEAQRLMALGVTSIISNQSRALIRAFAQETS